MGGEYGRAGIKSMAIRWTKQSLTKKWWKERGAKRNQGGNPNFSRCEKMYSETEKVMKFNGDDRIFPKNTLKISKKCAIILNKSSAVENVRKEERAK